MSIRFHVLASGSSGNACVLDVGGFGVLVDFGLSPRQLAPRMQRCKVTWDHIHAVLLTHGHTDHWCATTLSHLSKRGVPIYCHAEHVQEFNPKSRAFAAHDAAGLLRRYEPGERLRLHAQCECVPFALSHDSAMTCGFRFEGSGALSPNPSPRGRGEKGWAIGYAADLGCWEPALARQLVDVDVLALEFNHDVALQLASGRHPHLIRRVLGDAGHLSNEQGAELLAEVLRISEAGRVQHVVQLHLSRECNRADLAERAAQRVLERFGVVARIHTTDQKRAGPSITLGARSPGGVKRRAFVQPLLPFA